MLKLSALFVSVIFVAQVSAHYVFPNITIGGVTSGNWVNARQTNNYEDLNPLTDVTIPDMACYDSTESGTATTATVAAGSQLTVNVWGNPSTMYHPNVLNVYMAKAPSNVNGWTPTNAAWFKVYQITAVTDGGTSITFPAQNLPSFTFTLPSELPSGQYLVRVESIAIHSASYYGGAQFYISCIQLDVTNGGNGTPGPLVAFPGAYTGYEPGILLDIYYPIPTNYTQPGPPVWSPTGTSSTSIHSGTTTTPITTSTTHASTTTHTTTPTTISTSSSTAASGTGTPVAEYAQCGGTGWTGSTVCASPYVCTYSSAYYSQCLPA